MGENGAGKSTLARILRRLDPCPTAGGSCSMAGHWSLANPLDAQRLGIGIIYQELDLFPHLTRGRKSGDRQSAF